MEEEKRKKKKAKAQNVGGKWRERLPIYVGVFSSILDQFAAVTTIV